MVGQSTRRWIATAVGFGLLIMAARTAGSWAAPVPGAHAILTDTAQASAAIATFEARYRIDPRNDVLAARLADRYMARFAVAADFADVTRAEEIAQRLVHDAPRKSTAFARLSSILLAKHDFQGAWVAAEAAVQHEPGNEVGWAVLFDAAMAVGAYQTADTALSHLRTGSLGRELRYARWLTFHGDTEGAYQTMVRSCNEIRTSNLRPQVAAWCLTELAHIALARDGRHAAEQILKLALSTQPDYRGALEGLADLAAAEAEWKRAADLYNEIAVDAHPDIYLRLAEAAYAQGDTTRAREHEERFLDVVGDAENQALFAHPLALFLALDTATIGEAVAIMREDLRRRQPVETYATLAWVEFLAGNLDASREAVEHARAIGSPSPTVDYIYGMVLQATGDVEMARPFIESAIDNVMSLEPHVRRHWAMTVGGV